MPLAVFQGAGETVKPGDKLPVSVKGRDPEGYYELSRQKIARPNGLVVVRAGFRRQDDDQ